MTSDTNTVQITDTNFDDEIINSPIPVLVDFWAEWCGPCKVIGPTLEEIAGEFAGRAKIAKLNIDEYPELAGGFGIRSIPTLMLFNKGESVASAVGVRPKGDIVRMLEEHLPIH